MTGVTDSGSQGVRDCPDEHTRREPRRVKWDELVQEALWMRRAGVLLGPQIVLQLRDAPTALLGPWARPGCYRGRYGACSGTAPQRRISAPPFVLVCD